LDLYHNDMSVCSQKVRLVLREKYLAPTLHHLDLRAGDSHSLEYLKLNPKGVVPTLVDRGAQITESTVICEYLDEAYPETPLRPQDPIARSAMRRWTMIPDSGLHHAAATVSVAIAFRHQDSSRQIATFAGKALERARILLSQGISAPFVAEQVIIYDSVVGEVAKQLSKTQWLAGNCYSLADIAMIPYLCRLEHLAQEWLWEEDSTRTQISGWLSRCKATTGFAGISEFINIEYLGLMRRTGLEARPIIERILTQRS
jgi:glutathione S-transferase